MAKNRFISCPTGNSLDVIRTLNVEIFLVSKSLDAVLSALGVVTVVFALGVSDFLLEPNRLALFGLAGGGCSSSLIVVAGGWLPYGLYCVYVEN